jgi:hypothetical protein
MKLVPGWPRASKTKGGAVQEMLDTLQGCKKAALLVDDLLQELAHHLVDRCMPLGRHGTGFPQKLLFDDQSHIQSRHRLPFLLQD